MHWNFDRSRLLNDRSFNVPPDFSFSKLANNNSSPSISLSLACHNYWVIIQIFMSIWNLLPARLSSHQWRSGPNCLHRFFFLFFAYYIFRIIDIVVVKFHSIKNLFDREYRSYFHISTNTKKAQFQLTYLFKLVSSPDIFSLSFSF